MTVTEQDLANLTHTLRAEMTHELETLKTELGVQIMEAHNRTQGVTIEDVKSMIEAVNAAEHRLTLDDVRSVLPDHQLYDDEELRGWILRLKVFANELADRLGVERMKG